jgi:hypothetical protein
MKTPLFVEYDRLRSASSKTPTEKIEFDMGEFRECTRAVAELMKCVRDAEGSKLKLAQCAWGGRSTPQQCDRVLNNFKALTKASIEEYENVNKKQ